MDERKKLDGARAAIREHKEKYERFKDSAPEAINTALRTIRNAQNQINTILGRHPHWSPSWEDTWTP